MSLSELLQYLD